MSKYKNLVVIALLTLPSTTFAQNVVSNLISNVSQWVARLLPILTGLALLFFIWTAIQVIRAEGDKRDEAKKSLGWGIIALFAVISIWGLVIALQRVLGIEGESKAQISGPKIPN